ncbi:MAG: dihydrofolate reductase family protein, partial [Silvibacterium sp.]
MRKVIFAINITLDGCVDHTKQFVDEEKLEFGGVNVPSQLIELGLVDEYRFVVGPIVAGEGRRLLEGVSLPER